MKVAVVGLWHLGSVTAACLAKAGHDVIAYDPVEETILQLQNGKSPIFEPGLEALLKEGLKNNKLTCTSASQELTHADIVWVTFDTPVDNNDTADINYVMQQVIHLFPFLKENTLLIISSQLPVGTIQKLQEKYVSLYPNKPIAFACIPENLRLGKAIDVFNHPDRIVVGLDNQDYQTKLKELLSPFTDKLVWMSVVSAEMTKHAINAFLAVSVTFINELAVLCETVGANAREVELGLKSEERIGPKAYLRPGDAIAGGTLLRDINYLMQLGEEKQRKTFLISAISESNHYHKEWTCRKLTSVLRNLHGKKIAMLGLTYKVGTDTLRRSKAIETCQWLHSQGVNLTAYDPVVSFLPEELARFIQAKTTIQEALHHADAVVISTEWPQFRDLTANELLENLKEPIVIDPSGFIAKTMANDSRIQYFSVGVPS